MSLEAVSRHLLPVVALAVLAGCGGTSQVVCDTGTHLVSGKCEPVNTYTCGFGTTLVNGKCQPSSATITCGTGTHLSGSTCVADDGSSSTAGVAPTLTAIDPPNAGASGGVLFTLTGTGFAGTGVGDVHVYFGDPSNADCEAVVGTATATSLSGEVPAACAFPLSVLVTVTTDLGTATIPFQYRAIIAADGDGGGSTGAAGDLYLIDPLAQKSIDIGSISDGQGHGYGISALTFSAAGTLYAVTTGDSPADTGGVAQLLTINLTTNPGAVTVWGNVVDASDNPYVISDMKFRDGVFYAWGYTSDGNGGYTQGLVAIHPDTAVVTRIGAGAPDSYGRAGMAFDDNGTLYVAANAAGADQAAPSNGDLDTINTSTGALTFAATLDWPIGAPVNAMDWFGSTFVGVIDDGTYGHAGSLPIYGETLAIIAPQLQPVVYAVFELPAVVGSQSHVDAIATVPNTATAGPPLPHAAWVKLRGR